MRRICTWSKEPEEQGDGVGVVSRPPAPRKTATCVAANQDPARVHLAVNPEVCGGSSRRPVRKGGGIWQLGLLAGAAAGAAEVVAAPAPAREKPAAAAWREEPQGLRT